MTPVGVRVDVDVEVYCGNCGKTLDPIVHSNHGKICAMLSSPCDCNDNYKQQKLKKMAKELSAAKSLMVRMFGCDGTVKSGVVYYQCDAIEMIEAIVKSYKEED